MDRKEYKEYFNKYYKTPFVSVEQNGGNNNIDEKKRKVMEIAIKLLGDWYDNYFDLLFRKSAISLDDSLDFSIVSPPISAANNNKLVML